MIIEIFTLCDFAQDYQGKLFINGTFDTINVRQLPIVHPQLSVVLKVRFAENEAGEHDLKIKLIHTDGKEDLISGKMHIPNPPEGINYSTFQQVININNYEVKKAGKVSFELYIDDEFVEGIALGIIQVK